MSKRTKEAFAASLKKLMQNKPITKITVKDIVTDCEVGRKTFYYHFQDIYELLAWIYQTEAVEVLADCKTYDTWPTGIRRMVYFVCENQAFCKNAYNSIGRERSVNFLYPILCTLLTDIIDNATPKAEMAPEDKLFIVDFYAYAFIGLIIKWSLSDINDPEQYLNRMVMVMNNDFRETINKFSA